MLHEHLSVALAVRVGSRGHGVRAGQEHDVGSARSWKTLEALARSPSEIAEDAASTKGGALPGPARASRLDRPFEQPLGKRSAREKCGLSIPLGARLRRCALVPVAFRAEILTGALPPTVLAAYASREFGPAPSCRAAAVVVLLYGAELTLAAPRDFPLSWRMPGAMIVRDLALPVLWIDALAEQRLHLGTGRKCR